MVSELPGGTKPLTILWGQATANNASVGASRTLAFVTAKLRRWGRLRDEVARRSSPGEILLCKGSIAGLDTLGRRMAAFIHLPLPLEPAWHKPLTAAPRRAQAPAPGESGNKTGHPLDKSRFGARMGMPMGGIGI